MFYFDAFLLTLFQSAVPQATEFLDPPTLSKGKTEKAKNKKKEKKDKTPAVDAGGFTSFIPIRPLSASGSPEPSSMQRRNGDSPAPSMMKPSFSQISEPAIGSGSGTPVSGPSERTKVAFGFGTKRKAGEDGTGTPPTKRRS
jgi:U4/U6.U5 tri-snRNP-associated protein 1